MKNEKLDNIIKKKMFFVIVVGLFIFVPLVSSTNIGISPASLHYQKVLRGGYAEKSVVITADSDKETKVSLDTRGDVGSWIQFSKNNLSVTKQVPGQVIISVLPPEDIPNGNYSGYVRVNLEGTGEAIENHATGIVRTALDLYITVEITDQEIRECRATEFKVDSAEKGDPVIFSMNVENNGNIRLKPRITIDIWDQEQISIVKQVEFSNTEIIPTTQEKLILEVDTDDLELGQYWVDVSAVDCYSAQTLTFDVLEPGALKAEGVLKLIDAKYKVLEGETIPIKATFGNIGEKAVQAQFKGQINYGDRIVELLESEKMQVLVGEDEIFNFYFTPKKEGRYVVSGRVFYSGKRTYEKSAVINVFKDGWDLLGIVKQGAISMIYLFLIVSIAILIYKIRQERRSYNAKWRMLKRK